MTLVRCLVCDDILEVSVEGDQDTCGCCNKTTVTLDSGVIKIKGDDLTKIGVFRESSQSFQASAM